MGIDRLIRRETPENLLYGTVEQVDAQNRKALVSGRNGLAIWAGYGQGDFPTLEAGQTVAVGIATGDAFLVRQLSAVLPSTHQLLIV